ncbi:hypothetical protein IAI10_07990 [Clostridium sp. 19966]|uniref:hypothetical protein n=1 Tax=Clostridium sp. 19966 TaxID=2768166 RepID=UPI0028DF20C3|nr:hypothetical protein [Clostridium sp. 19966]MDT8716594.1 hypothetical protein [Clostridium sp. 19966]
MKTKVLILKEDNIGEAKQRISSDSKANYCFVLYEEDICIINIKLPKVKKKLMDKIVENQMLHKFMNMEQISFSYSINNINNNICDVFVYCINSYKLEILKEMNKKRRVRGIYLIQFCYMEYVIRNFNVNTFLIAAKSGDTLYFIGCEKGKLKYSSILKINELQDVNSFFIAALQSAFTNNDDEQVYLLNCSEYFDTSFPKTHIIRVDCFQEEILIKKYVEEIK